MNFQKPAYYEFSFPFKLGMLLQFPEPYKTEQIITFSHFRGTGTEQEEKCRSQITAKIVIASVNTFLNCSFSRRLMFVSVWKRHDIEALSRPASNEEIFTCCIIF